MLGLVIVLLASFANALGVSCVRLTLLTAAQPHKVGPQQDTADPETGEETRLDATRLGRWNGNLHVRLDLDLADLSASQLCSCKLAANS